MLNTTYRAFRDYWQTTTRAQRLLFISGTVLLLWMLGHIAAIPFFDGDLHGPVSPRKAITFAETGWLMCWSVGYLLPYLNGLRWQSWTVIAGVLQFGLLETLLVSVQVWRGVPSHYNFATPLDMTIFSVMGAGSLVFLIGMVVLLVALFGRQSLPPDMLAAYRGGAVLMIIGGLTGYLMMANLGGTFTGNLSETLQTVASGGMIGTFAADPSATGGNIVVLHALGVHGLSLAPLAAWLLGYTAVGPTARLWTVRAVNWGLYALLAVLAVPLFRLQPLTQVGPLVVGLAGAAALVVVGALGWSGWRALRIVRA